LQLSQKSRAAQAVLIASLSLYVLVSTSGSIGASARRVQLRVVVHGAGDVTARAARTCHRSCRWYVPAGRLIRLRAVAREDARFQRWGKPCGRARSCSVRLRHATTITAVFAGVSAPSPEPPPTPGSPPAPPAPPSPPAPVPPPQNLDASLANPHVTCVPILWTIPAILGSRENANGGATETGGVFQPHLAGDDDRHLLDPPCSIQGESTLVELHGVYVQKFTPAGDGDWTGNLVDPNRPDITNPYMKTIHAEIDSTWISAGVAPMPAPSAGMTIDIRGFVYWDPGHLDASWHSFSGWELHPVTAWHVSAG
jgi:hypothetical protein